MVGKNAVTATDDQIAPVLRQVKLLRSIYAVMKGNGCVRQYDPIGGLTVFGANLLFFGRKLTTGAGIDNASVLRVRRVRYMELTAAAKAGVDQTFVR